MAHEAQHREDANRQGQGQVPAVLAKELLPLASVAVVGVMAAEAMPLGAARLVRPCIWVPRTLTGLAVT